ncbi:hypothetical protein HCN51_36385 [Nonomuraea sp. FMUSA5-5]|uniref:Excreted virulence factor EspC, type VII ESX diderm n=1 Tax=Nonomuraea composti TaxID=2720023 RepID=A0ABX1BAP6_9ACTN|nr:hypothetical protein [Nonomuraea sp. FMUSA5-5]NJP94854.1 hypothetical protein [Nonomuraea sp. FMUSA5-5]
MSGSPDGFTVEAEGVRRRGGDAAEEAEFVEAVRDDVREAFAAAGRPMGHDQYGAELDKSFPRLREQIFDAFAAYLDELHELSTGLGTAAGNYEAADQPLLRPEQG